MVSVRAAGVWSAFAFVSISLAQDQLSKENYVRPPKPIEEAVLAPWYKNRNISSLSPDRSRYLVIERDGMTSIALLAKPYANLGGVMIDTVSGRQRSLTTRSSAGIVIGDVRGGKDLTVQVPTGSRVSDASWSPDGRTVAYMAHFHDRSELWAADAATGKSRQVTATRLQPTLATVLEWVDDGRSLVTLVVPEGRKPAPKANDVPDGPRVQISDDRPTRIRTYASLLSTPTEQEQLEYYATTQLARIDLATGKVTPIGKPAMIRSVDPQPDGKFFRVTLMEKPFSYLFPASSFPEREVLWDEKGMEKAQIRRRGLPLTPPAPTTPTTPTTGPGTGRRGGGGQGTPGSAAGQQSSTEKRFLGWRPDGAGLLYLQQQGSGSDARDRLVLWKAPFGEKDVEVLFETPIRMSSVRFGPDSKTLFVTQTVEGRTRTSIVRPSAEPVTLFEVRPGEDDPADLVTKPGPKAGSVVRMSTDGKLAYMAGTDYSSDPLTTAPRPYLDTLDLATGKRENVWKSREDHYEQATMLDDDLNQLLVTRQSPSMVPQTFLVDRRAGSEKQLTQNQDFVPDLTQARRETITVTRNDGIKFRVRVTLPTWHVAYAKYPAFFWFYPREYTSQAEYDRTLRTFNKNLFNQVGGSNKAILLRAGYVLVEPDCPIIGPAERKNDAYVPQLRNNLAATIDELDRRGLIDRTRLALGGHSYGAFSTANAMVHTPFFKAGIAGDGNFNRSLTPFGFQSDQRQIWESRESYLAMSPILWAEQLTGALLMYHGMDDQNMGTDPINSVRMFGALEALGKPAALYMYPFEDHGQIAEETVLDQWARWVDWLDKWVKNAM